MDIVVELGHSPVGMGLVVVAVVAEVVADIVEVAAVVAYRPVVAVAVDIAEVAVVAADIVVVVVGSMLNWALVMESEVRILAAVAELADSSFVVAALACIAAVASA